MKFLPSLTALTALVLVSPAALALDWPQWRGPARDGVLNDPNHPLTSLPPEPKSLWQLEVGPGQSSPIEAGGKVVYLDGENGQETAHCVDLASGKSIWTTPIAPMVEFQNKYGEGPRCTPLIEADRVYVQSCSGEFRCLNLADGKTRWRTNFEKDYGATFLGNKSNDPEAKETASRRHGNNGSAVIDGNRIFVPVGSPKGATLVCFDKMTGKEQWRAGNDNTAYSSVVVGTLAGTRQVVHFTADALMGVAAESGKILWRTPLKTGAKRHVATPVISGDTVTVTSTSIGTIKFNIARKGAEYTAEEAWKNMRLKTVIGSPVLFGKLLFTIGPGDRTELVCVDFETGKELWTQPGLSDYASLAVINGNLLVLNSTGELILAKATGEAYQELGRLQVAGKTWASPAFADGKLIVKDDKHLSALALTN